MLCLHVAELKEEDVVMPLLVVLGSVTSHLMSDVKFVCGALYAELSTSCSYRVIILLYGMLGSRDFLYISILMHFVRFLL